MLLSLLTLGCTPKPMEKPAAKPPEVLTTLAVSETIVDFEEFTGHTEAKNMIEIRARVTGYLDKVNFKEGGLVKKGQILFEIDPRPEGEEEDINATLLTGTIAAKDAREKEHILKKIHVISPLWAEPAPA